MMKGKMKVMFMKQFNLKQSPFYKERNLDNKDKTISFRVPQDIYDDLESYFEETYEKNHMSNGMNDLMLKTLDSLCSERKVFKNLVVYMILPNTNDISELNAKSEIFALIDLEHDIKQDFNHELINQDYNDDDNSLHFFHAMDKLDNEFPFPFFMFLDKECFHDVDVHDLVSLEDFKKEFHDAYPKIDIDDCFIAKFNLNNYLDVFRNGQYQDYTLNEFHHSCNVLTYGIRRYYCIIEWYFSIDGYAIVLSPSFYTQYDFTKRIKESKHMRMLKEFELRTLDEHSLKEIMQGEIDATKELIALYQKRLEDLESHLDKSLDEMIEDNLFDDEGDLDETS